VDTPRGAAVATAVPATGLHTSSMYMTQTLKAPGTFKMAG
jgi:hypothetical protein